MINRNSSPRGTTMENSLIEGARYTLRNLEGPFTFICTLSIPTGESGFPGVISEQYFIFKDSGHKSRSFQESPLRLVHNPVRYFVHSPSQPKCIEQEPDHYEMLARLVRSI